ITGKDREAVEAEFAQARGYGELKARVADAVIAELTPIRQRYAALIAEPGALSRILARGAEHARSIAEPKVREMMRPMGLPLPGSREPATTGRATAGAPTP